MKPTPTLAACTASACPRRQDCARFRARDASAVGWFTGEADCAYFVAIDADTDTVTPGEADARARRPST